MYRSTSGLDWCLTRKCGEEEVVSKDTSLFTSPNSWTLLLMAPQRRSKSTFWSYILFLQLLQTLPRTNMQVIPNLNYLANIYNLPLRQNHIYLPYLLSALLQRDMRIFPSKTQDYMESYFSEAHCLTNGMLTTIGHSRVGPAWDSGHGGDCQWVNNFGNPQIWKHLIHWRPTERKSTNTFIFALFHWEYMYRYFLSCATTPGKWHHCPLEKSVSLWATKPSWLWFSLPFMEKNHKKLGNLYIKGSMLWYSVFIPRSKKHSGLFSTFGVKVFREWHQREILNSRRSGRKPFVCWKRFFQSDILPLKGLDNVSSSKKRLCSTTSRLLKSMGEWHLQIPERENQFQFARYIIMRLCSFLQQSPVCHASYYNNYNSDGVQSYAEL